MSIHEILEYLRVYASLKRNLADKMDHSDRQIAYDDVVQEIGRLESMLLRPQEVQTVLRDTISELSH
jgi:hypothetical protein